MGWNRATIDKPDRARIMGLRVVMRSLARQTAGTWGRAWASGYLTLAAHIDDRACRLGWRQWASGQCAPTLSFAPPSVSHGSPSRGPSSITDSNTGPDPDPLADGPGGINHKWAGWDRLGGKLSGALHVSIWETSGKLRMIWMGPVRPSVSTRLEESLRRTVRRWRQFAVPCLDS